VVFLFYGGFGLQQNEEKNNKNSFRLGDKVRGIMIGVENGEKGKGMGG
jgi:hypothetical protein